MRKKILIVIADILAVIIAYGLALLLRFDMRYSKIPELYIEGYLYYIVLASVLLVCCYVIAKLYRSVWSYAGINEILKTCVASIVASDRCCIFNSDHANADFFLSDRLDPGIWIHRIHSYDVSSASTHANQSR